jgi:hypothetical protein
MEGTHISFSSSYDWRSVRSGHRPRASIGRAGASSATVENTRKGAASNHQGEEEREKLHGDVFVCERVDKDQQILVSMTDLRKAMGPGTGNRTVV